MSCVARVEPSKRSQLAQPSKQLLMVCPTADMCSNITPTAVTAPVCLRCTAVLSSGRLLLPLLQQHHPCPVETAWMHQTVAGCCHRVDPAVGTAAQTACRHLHMRTQHNSSDNSFSIAELVCGGFVCSPAQPRAADTHRTGIAVCEVSLAPLSPNLPLPPPLPKPPCCCWACCCCPVTTHTRQTR